jgi:hypothetical protein
MSSRSAHKFSASGFDGLKQRVAELNDIVEALAGPHLHFTLDSPVE